MIRYQELQTLNEQDFKRLTGISHSLFKEIAEFLRKQAKRKLSKGGNTFKLPGEDMLMMTLIYLREYRTYLSYRSGLFYS